MITMPNDMRDRLVELISDMENELLRSYPYTTDEYRIACLADHLIENGAILPPCVPKDDEYYRVYDEHGNYIAVIYSEKGKTVFLTREDAEKSLREREGE